MNHVTAQKNELRATLIESLTALTKDEIAEKSARICERFKTQIPLATINGTAFVYVSMPQEAQTDALIGDFLLAGVRVAVPKITRSPRSMRAYALTNFETDLAPGAYGIREPKDGAAFVLPETIALVVVPGLGFDLNGNRLGRGKGYYDEFFSVNSAALRVALAFDFQMFESALPVTERDFPVDMIITETNVYRFDRLKEHEV